MYYDLSSQNTLDALLNSPLSLHAAFFINKEVFASLQRDVAQEFHDADHRIVVEGEMLVVTREPRIILRPAAVVVLRLEQIVHAFQKSLAVARQSLRGIDARQECQLRVGRAVVNGRIVLTLLLDEVGLLLLGQHNSHVNILVPPACVALIEQQDVCDTNGLAATVPFRLLLESVAPLHYGTHLISHSCLT